MKRRPAVVISSAAYNAEMRDVIVMPVTSQMRGQARPRDVIVTDWAAAGLLKPSAIKPLIATIDRDLILRVLGRLAEHDIAALHDGLAELIGTPPAA